MENAMGLADEESAERVRIQKHDREEEHAEIKHLKNTTASSLRRGLLRFKVQAGELQRVKEGNDSRKAEGSQKTFEE